MTTPAGTTVSAPADRGDADERYLTQLQFCQLYQIPARTAENWRANGDGPPYTRLGPRKIRYRLSDCRAWAAARTFAHRADELSRSSTATPHDQPKQPEAP
jgi:hypothetical protein